MPHPGAKSQQFPILYCGATPMVNLKCRRIRKEYKSGRKEGLLYAWSPSIPSLPTYSKFSNPLFVTNSILNWFLSGQMLWAPFLRPLGVTRSWTWNSKYNCRNLQTKTRRKNRKNDKLYTINFFRCRIETSFEIWLGDIPLPFISLPFHLKSGILG